MRLADHQIKGNEHQKHNRHKKGQTAFCVLVPFVLFVLVPYATFTNSFGSNASART
jgi:hypothetical protein